MEEILPENNADNFDLINIKKNGKKINVILWIIVKKYNYIVIFFVHIT
jgi:hypothetical protein